MVKRCYTKDIYLFDPPPDELDSDVEVTPAEVADALRHPANFMYTGGDRDMFRTWSMSIVHRTRDANILEQSNAAALEHELRSDPTLDEDWRIERFGSTMGGWADHVVFRAVEDDLHTPTRIFRVLKEWFTRLKEVYPVANEEDYSRREYEAAIDNIKYEGKNLVLPGFPEDWADRVWDWLWDHDQEAVQNTDGNGAYPNLKQITTALQEIGLLPKVEQLVCNACGQDMIIGEDGIAHHIDDDGDIDHEADAGHTAYPLET